MKLIVNGLNVPEHVIENEIQRATQMMQGAPEEIIKSRVKEQLTRQALVRDAASKSPINVPQSQIDAQFEHFIEQQGGLEPFLAKNELNESHLAQIKIDIQTNIKIEMFLDTLTKDALMPAEKMLREYHQRDHKLLYTPKKWHVSHIVKRPGDGVFEEMCQIRKALLEGASFAEKANSCSNCQDENGDLGWIEAGALVPEFESVIFSMNLDEISPVFLTQYGYHIATVLGVEEPRKTDYDEVENKVKQEVMMRMKENMINQWIEASLKTAVIDTDLA